MEHMCVTAFDHWEICDLRSNRPCLDQFLLLQHQRLHHLMSRVACQPVPSGTPLTHAHSHTHTHTISTKKPRCSGLPQACVKKDKNRLGCRFWNGVRLLIPLDKTVINNIFGEVKLALKHMAKGPNNRSTTESRYISDHKSCGQKKNPVERRPDWVPCLDRPVLAQEGGGGV